MATKTLHTLTSLPTDRLVSCLVVTTNSPRLVVAHDDAVISVGFADRLCRGAINAQHYRLWLISLLALHRCPGARIRPWFCRTIRSRTSPPLHP